MPTIEELTTEMLPQVQDTLLTRLNPDMPAERWHTLFSRGWQPDSPHGYAMLERGRVVGMLGTLFSTRQIQGQARHFCNLHSWYVEPEHRATSLLLLRPLLALRQHTLTDFSPSPRVLVISQRLGFKPLDHRMLLLPRLPAVRASGIEAHWLAPGDPRAATFLEPHDLRIFHDHQGIDCGHLLVRADGEYCYMVSSTQRQGRLGYRRLHYVSHPALFARRQSAIRAHLLDDGMAACALVSSRLVAGQRIPYALHLDTNQTLYRGDEVAPPQIDALYSEMPVLKLPVEFSVARRVRALLDRLRGRPVAGADD